MEELRKEKARHTAILPSKDGTDTRGVRAMENLVSHEECPIKTICQADKDKEEYIALQKDIEKIHQELTSDLQALHEVADLGEQLKRGTITDKWAKQGGKVPKLKELEHLDMHQYMDTLMDKVKASGEDMDRLLLAEKAVIYIDMLERLNGHTSLRRLHSYTRTVNPHRYRTPAHVKARYIIWPMCLFAMAFAFQSFMLHAATHFYVYYMDHGSAHRRHEGGQLFDLVGNGVAQFLVKNQTAHQGPVIQGSIKIPLKVLDASGAIPALLCVVAYLISSRHDAFNIGLWMKTGIVASMCAIMKGLFDVVTILPDSIGWASCQERLSKPGLAEMRRFHWFDDFWGTLWSALLEELVGGENGKRVRYCADMMISGHTYIAVLAALSAYKQVAFATDVIPNKWGINQGIRRIIAVVCTLCICTELCLVAAARFHYTVDIVAALAIVFLLWDSFTVEQIAADWSEGFSWRCETTYKSKSCLWSFWSQPDAVKEAEVLPSQSTLLNLRLLTGHAPWTDPHDIVVHEENIPPRGMAAGSSSYEQGDVSGPLLA